ncbi:hypothetical protein [Streptomyces hydrogenans]|uniref:hypothetical protein n=1 Tax=Streptomyces hydrogenans TaxID=1873719 RepID=UPI0035E1974C
MVNPINAMRNINCNLFEHLPDTADALLEYDPDAAGLVRKAAGALHAARHTHDTAGFEQADTLTRRAAAVLLAGAGSSVSVRYAVMIAARLVELEAAALAGRERNAQPEASAKRPARINGLKTWPDDGTLPPRICRVCRTNLDDDTEQLASAICVVCGYWVCEVCDGGTDPTTGDAVCDDHKSHPLAANCTEYA